MRTNAERAPRNDPWRPFQDPGRSSPGQSDPGAGETPERPRTAFCGAGAKEAAAPTLAAITSNW